MRDWGAGKIEGAAAEVRDDFDVVRIACVVAPDRIPRRAWDDRRATAATCAAAEWIRGAPGSRPVLYPFCSTKGTPCCSSLARSSSREFCPEPPGNQFNGVALSGWSG